MHYVKHFLEVSVTKMQQTTLSEIWCDWLNFMTCPSSNYVSCYLLLVGDMANGYFIYIVIGSAKLILCLQPVLPFDSHVLLPCSLPQMDAFSNYILKSSPITAGMDNQLTQMKEIRTKSTKAFVKHFFHTFPA